ncbi:MAG: molybdopterin converting factor subunit 1 [Alphaproteobacteria bacterium]|nr:molybdopterin converting factor subunit 1 [Alphaproteobacteria bacterium]
MKLLYFAWLRERIGHVAEDLVVPPEVKTVRELIAWLKARGPGYAAALDDLSVVRAAVNQEYVPLDHPVKNADEVAFFPPVTGG